LKRNQNSSRKRRGFTLMELAVASLIGIVFAAMIAQTLVTATDLTNTTIRTTSLESDHRIATDILQRYLKGARPLEQCSTTTPGQCLTFTSVENAFYKASPTEVQFFAYTCATGTTGGVPTCAKSNKGAIPPDLVKINFADSASGCLIGRPCPVSIKVYKPKPLVTQQMPLSVVGSYETQPASEINVGLFENSSFTFYADDRSVLNPGTTPASLALISIVEIELRSAVPNPDPKLSALEIRTGTIVGIASKEYGYLGQ